MLKNVKSNREGHLLQALFCILNNSITHIKQNFSCRLGRIEVLFQNSDN